jgi:hypothetical protein
MVESTNPKFEIKWQIDIGDLVRVKKYSHEAAMAETYTYKYGIVVGLLESHESLLFPAAQIRFFKSDAVMIYAVGQMEIVSHV